MNNMYICSKVFIICRAGNEMTTRWQKTVRSKPRLTVLGPTFFFYSLPPSPAIIREVRRFQNGHVIDTPSRSVPSRPVKKGGWLCEPKTIAACSMASLTKDSMILSYLAKAWPHYNFHLKYFPEFLNLLFDFRSEKSELTLQNSSELWKQASNLTLWMNT